MYSPASAALPQNTDSRQLSLFYSVPLDLSISNPVTGFFHKSTAETGFDWRFPADIRRSGSAFYNENLSAIMRAASSGGISGLSMRI